jgi:hypothetical protein
MLKIIRVMSACVLALTLITAPMSVAAVEWLGGIGASLRHIKAPPGEYHYGKATITFNGKRVTRLVTADGHVVDHRKKRHHK